MCYIEVTFQSKAQKPTSFCMAYQGLPPELLKLVRQYVSLSVKIAGAAVADSSSGPSLLGSSSHPDSAFAETLPQRIADLTQFNPDEDDSAYFIPPLVPCSNGGIIDVRAQKVATSGPRPLRQSAANEAKSSDPQPHVQGVSTRPTSTTVKTKAKSSKLTKSQKKEARIARIRERAYKPRLLDHGHVRRTANSADVWWDDCAHMKTEWRQASYAGSGVSSFFSWAEWSSEQLRTGELLLQHYCAKHFQTTWLASNLTTKERIVGSLLETFKGVKLLEMGSIKKNEENVIRNEMMNAGLILEHLAIGRPSGDPPFVASFNELKSNNKLIYAAGGLAVFLNELELAVLEYIYSVPSYQLMERRLRRLRSDSQKVASVRQKRKKARKKNFTMELTEAPHARLWRSLNLMLTLAVTHENDNAFREVARGMTVGETGRSLAAFAIELLMHTLPSSKKSNDASSKPFPIRKVVLFTAFFIRIQCGSFAEIAKSEKPAKSSPKTVPKIGVDGKIATVADHTKPIFPLKSRKGRIFEAEQRVRECQMDAAIAGGSPLSGDSTILQHSQILRKHLHLQNGGRHTRGVSGVSNGREEVAPGSVLASCAENLFVELRPQLHKISVVLIQLLLACTPRDNSNSKKALIESSSDPPSPSRNLLVDAMQDFVLEHTQPRALSNTEELYPPILRVDEGKKSDGNQVQEAELLRIRHKVIISRASSQIILSLLKVFRMSHVLHGHCFAQHLVDAQAVLAGLTWLNVKLSSLIGGTGLSPQYMSPAINYFNTENASRNALSHSKNDCAPIERNSSMACLNVLRILQKLTKHYPERISSGLVKYNSSILLKKVLRLQRDGLDAATFYGLKLFKSQVRYLGVGWRKGNISIINGVSRNIRIDLVDRWLIPQDPSGVPGSGGMLPGEGIYNPSEAATRWAVASHNDMRSTAACSGGLASELRIGIVKNVKADESESTAQPLSAQEEKEALFGERNLTPQQGTPSPDALLCLDGVHAEELLMRSHQGNSFDSARGEHDVGFQVDGVGYWQLYQKTSLPAGFESRWQDWCASELAC